MTRLVIYGRADLGRACLCVQLHKHRDIDIVAAGDDLAGQVGRAELDTVLVLPPDADRDPAPVFARIQAFWPAAAVLIGRFTPETNLALAQCTSHGQWISFADEVDAVVPTLRNAAADPVPPGAPPAGSRCSLTVREAAVLKHLALGYSSRESARALGLRPRTVDHHRRNVSSKLGLASVPALTRYAIRSSLIEATSGFRENRKSA